MAANGGADAWRGHSKQWRSRIWCLSPTHTGRRTISPLTSVCLLPSKLCWDAHRPRSWPIPVRLAVRVSMWDRGTPLNFHGHMCNFLMYGERLPNANGGQRGVMGDYGQRRGKRLPSTLQTWRSVTREPSSVRGDSTASRISWTTGLSISLSSSTLLVCLIRPHAQTATAIAPTMPMVESSQAHPNHKPPVRAVIASTEVAASATT